MKTYNVAKGTEGKLITNEDNEDVQVENWTVRKLMSFDKTKILVNPEDRIIIPCPYPEDSMAFKMLSEGYIIFSNSGEIDSKYMLAVQYSDVEITDE